MGIRRVKWHEARNNIRKAVRTNPSVSYLKVFQDEKEGYCKFWEYGKCHFVTRVDANRDGTRLVVCLLAGEELFEWGYELAEELEALAKAEGCQKIAVEGRLGWVKLLKPLGYEHEVTTMVRQLWATNRKPKPQSKRTN